MHCAPQTQIPWNLSYSKLLIVVKGFISKIWYPFEQHGLSVRNNCHTFERLWLSVRKRNVICLNDSGYLLERNFHPFDWLGLSSIHLKKTVICLNSSSYPFKTYCQLCYCSKALSPEPFATFTNLSKHVSLNNNILVSIVYHHLMNFHGTFSAK